MTAAAQLLTEYDAWVERQALVPRTRSAYRRWVHELVEHLEAGDELTAFLAQDGEHDRRAVVADWRRRLVDQRLAPSTINSRWPPWSWLGRRVGWVAAPLASGRAVGEIAGHGAGDRWRGRADEAKRTWISAPPCRSV
jgi:hypothetical protein